MFVRKSWAKKTEPEGSAFPNRPESGQFLVPYTVRLGSGFAQAFLAIRFVLGVVTFEEHRLRVIFIREDVGRDAVEEPPIVRDHNGGAREVQQGFFQGTQGFNVEVVGRFVEQQDVATLFQGQGQVQATTLTTGQVLDELLLVATLEVETADVGARRDFIRCDTDLDRTRIC